MSEEPAGPSPYAPDVAKIRRDLAWDQIALPSDRIPLGRLRQAVGGSHKTLGALVHDLVSTELQVAEQALAVALWMPYDADRTHFHKVLEQEETGYLQKQYKDAGIGSQEATQMIRELQDWAAAEARKHLPDRPR